MVSVFLGANLWLSVTSKLGGKKNQKEKQQNKIDKN